MKYDVFISYKSQSINVVKAIVHVLENEDIRCWYAPRDLDSHSAGKDYDDKIVEAITECQLLVVVLSNAALNSDWVKAEVALAQKQKKLVIPYVVSELQVENGLRMRLESKHWIDAYPNPERKFSLLLKNIKLVLNNSASEDESNQNEKRFNMDYTEDYSVDFDYDEGVALLEAKEYNDAALAFMASAERGNNKAKNCLCQMFYDMEGAPEQIQGEIWDSIERQAKEGHCYANFLMHCKVYKDASNNLVSFEYLKKAIRSNSIGLAFLRMGIQYNWGMGVKQSHTLGMHYYQKALALECKEAYSYIGQEYAGGSDKTAKNEDIAIDYYIKGTEKGDMRSYFNLTRYYLYDKKDRQKAIEIAQKAINNGYKRGYSLMGDIYLGDYSELEEDKEEAIKWYKEGLRHDDKSCYGSLAMIYYNQGDYDEAYNMSKRGRYANDSHSIYMLGAILENDDKLDEAWQCYREQYDKFGIGADNLAHLIMDRGYRPEGISDEAYKQMLDELEQWLEILARNYNQNCLESLLKLYSYRTEGVASLDYDIVKKVPKAADFIKLGAEMGTPEMMYYLGNSIVSDIDNEKLNPYKGLEWIEKAANAGYGEAIGRLIDLYSNGRFKDDEALKKIFLPEKESALAGNKESVNRLLSRHENPYLEDSVKKELVKFSVLNFSFSEDTLPFIIDNSIDFCGDILSDLRMFFKKLIDDQPFMGHLEANQISKVTAKFMEISERLNVDVEKEMLIFIKKFADEQIANQKYDVLSGISRWIPTVYPEYNDETGYRDFMNNKGSLNSKLYYITNFAKGFTDYDATKMDPFMDKLLAPIVNNPCLDEIIKLEDDSITNGEEIWSQPLINLANSYNNICKEFNIHPHKFLRCSFNCIAPYFPALLVLEYRMEVIRCLLSIKSCDPLIESEFLANIDSDEQLLNICEKISNQDLQLFLICFVELRIDSESLMLQYSTLLKYKEQSNYQKLADYLNEYIERINKANIENDLKEFSAEDVQELLKENVKDEDLQNKNVINRKDLLQDKSLKNDDDFEKLLNDFLAFHADDEKTEDGS